MENCCQVQNLESIHENQRVRMNLSQNAKGMVQFDCTVEFETVEKCGKSLREAIDEIKAIIKEKGLMEVGSN